MDPVRVFVLAVLAGAFIALGAVFSTVALSGAGTAPWGPIRVLAGVAFSLGLVLVVVGGAELFTGNNLIVMAWAAGRIRTGSLALNWAIVYAGNFVGALSIALMVAIGGTYRLGSGAYGTAALGIASAKLGLSFPEAIALGILCNVLVCLAVWLSYSARTTADRILAVIYADQRVRGGRLRALGRQHVLRPLRPARRRRRPGIHRRPWAHGPGGSAHLARVRLAQPRSRSPSATSSAEPCWWGRSTGLSTSERARPESAGRDGRPVGVSTGLPSNGVAACPRLARPRDRPGRLPPRCRPRPWPRTRRGASAAAPRRAEPRRRGAGATALAARPRSVPLPRGAAPARCGRARGLARPAAGKPRHPGRPAAQRGDRIRDRVARSALAVAAAWAADTARPGAAGRSGHRGPGSRAGARRRHRPPGRQPGACRRAAAAERGTSARRGRAHGRKPARRQGGLRYGLPAGAPLAERSTMVYLGTAVLGG